MVNLCKLRLGVLAKSLTIVFLLGFTAETGFAQENFATIIGTVTDEGTGNPLVGTNVYLVDTGLGTLTSQNGTFIIERVPPGTYQVEFSYLSYRTFTVEVTVGAGQRSSVNASLELDPLMLDEIVVTGYGTARKEELTGSMVSIAAADLEMLPTPTFQDVIQGSPGVQVSARDGAPGAGFNIRVRGIGSITAGSEPLYVIDGVPIYNNANTITQASFDNGGRTANTLASINPNDIESVVVLKDAASTAIYGSRGANGVVLITTKGGVSGTPIWASEPRLEFNYQFGASDWAFDNLQEGLNGEQYHDYYISARMASGMSEADAETQFLGHWPMGIQNNVWGDIITRTGYTHQYDLSATGGSGRYSYFVSAGIWDQTGTMKANFFDRYSSRANLTAQLTDNFSLANNLSYAWTRQGGITDGSAWAAPMYQIVFSPPAIPIYDEEGEFYAAHTHTMGANHPLGHLVEDERTRETSRFIDNLTGTYRFRDNFTFASAWSFDIYNVDDYSYGNPRYGDGRNSGGYSYDARSNNVGWQGTQTLNFNEVFSTMHNVDALAGYEAASSRRDRTEIDAESFAHPELKRAASAALITGASADRSSYTFQSLFARVNYDYDRTYFLSGSFRRDGSSRFGPENKYGNFWSIGAGWTLTNQAFMQDFDFFDYLKLRGSFGQVGNADIGNYEWQGLYTFSPSYNGQPGSRPSQVANNVLTWESQGSFNVGLDYAFMDNRFTGTLEYFQKTSSDLLLNVPISPTTGFTSILQNFGDMENSGFEFSVHAEILRTQDYDLGLDFNFTKQSNEITHLEDPIVDWAFRREQGRDFYEYYMYPWAGVDPATGKPTYYKVIQKEKEVDGEIVKYNEVTDEITSKVSETDRVYLDKSAIPDYMGSFGLTGRYGDFTLAATATYSFGHYVHEDAARHYEGDGRYLPRSTSKFAWENSWKQPGDNVPVPQQKWGGNSGSREDNSARWLFQGDYIRLRNVTLSYRLPGEWAQRVGTSTLDVHFRADNYFTWVADDLLHFDPEQSVNGIYNTNTPMSKTISFGVRAGF